MCILKNEKEEEELVFSFLSFVGLLLGLGGWGGVKIAVTAMPGKWNNGTVNTVWNYNSLQWVILVYLDEVQDKEEKWGFYTFAIWWDGIFTNTVNSNLEM